VTGSTHIPIPRIVMRNYLSTQHLYAARYAAEDAQAREVALKRQDVFDIRNRGCVLTAVVESVAFLEAAINELYQDSTDGHPSSWHAEPAMHSSHGRPSCSAVTSKSAGLPRCRNGGRRPGVEQRPISGDQLTPSVSDSMQRPVILPYTTTEPLRVAAS
jgi:hypothetical protein